MDRRDAKEFCAFILFLCALFAGITLLLAVLLSPLFIWEHASQLRTTNAIVKEFEARKPLVAYSMGSGKDERVFESALEHSYVIGHIQNSSVSSTMFAPTVTSNGMGVTFIPTTSNSQMVVFMLQERK